MKSKRVTTLGALISNAGTALAKPISSCWSDDDAVCYQWGVPSSTAQSGNGGIYFQLSAPTEYRWVGLGIGTGMAGAQIFVMYQDGHGNVTLSPRKGEGHVMPNHVPDGGVTLLEGSGVVDGKMIANIKCANCSSNENIDLRGQSSWIAAWQKGQPLNTDDPAAVITIHDDKTPFQVDFSQASISTDSNPFVADGGDASSPPSSSDGSSGGAVTQSGDEGNTEHLVLVHGIIMTLVFVGLYPLGSILMPLLGKWFIHAGWQTIAFLLMWAGFGIGYTAAKRYDIFFDQPHTRLGTIVVALMGIQPVFGWLHHKQFEKTGQRGIVSHLHSWYGRILMLLGIVNGGLGLKLAVSSTAFKTTYIVLAAVIGAAYIAAGVFGVFRRGSQGQSRRSKSPPASPQDEMEHAR